MAGVNGGSDGDVVEGIGRRKSKMKSASINGVMASRNRAEMGGIKRNGVVKSDNNSGA